MVVSEARTQTSSSATLHGLLEDSADLRAPVSGAIGVDLSLELGNTPISDLRLDLVEGALRRVRYLRQRAVVRPAQPAGEAGERASWGYGAFESSRNITSLVMLSRETSNSPRGL